jgi:gliding motility-associated-like protein/uncharacterized repeat protein (TIGR01451 family)
MTLTKSATLNDGGDGSLDLGDTITYTLTLTNTGNVSLSSVSLTDTITDLSGAALSLQSGPTYITGGTSFTSTSIMDVDDVIVYEAVFEINQQAINAGGVSNTAEASVTTPSQDSLTATSNTVNTPISSTASLEVNKTATINDNGDGVNGLSDLIEYTITVENTGDIALENLTITDVITDNVGNSLSLVSGPFFAGSTVNSAEGKLKVGEVASYKAYYIITQQAVDAGGVVNNVNATANVPGSTSIVSDDLDTPTITTITEDPEIEVIKTAIISDNGDGVTGLGDTIDYTIRISNTGNVTLNSLTLIDTITDATGVALASSPLVTSFVSSDQNSTAGNLAVGETATYTTSYVIDQNAVDSGGVLNSVTADASSPAGTSIFDMSDDGDPTTDTDADVDNDPTNDPTYTSIEASPSFTLSKVVANIIDEGDGYNGTDDLIEYLITATNTGNVTLTLDSLVDVLTDGANNNLILTTAPTFNAGTTLEVGETLSFTADYLIASAAADTKLIRNTVSITASGPSSTTITLTDAVDVVTGAEASMKVVKTWELSSDLDSDGIVDDGDTIRFIVSVKNTGNVDVTGITLEDTFIDGGGNAVSFNGGTTTEPRPLNFIGSTQSSSEGSLFVGETATYDALYTVSTTVFDTGLVSNTVTAIGYSQGAEIRDVSDDGDDLDGNTENDPTRITMGSNPDVLVTKTQEVSDNDGTLGVGDIVTYSISISNQGNVPLTWSASDIIDVMTDGDGNILSFNTGPTWSYSNKGSGIGSIVDGETAFYTATYVIEQSTVDQGSIQNRVTVKVSTPDGTIIEATADGDKDDTTDADGDGDTENDPLILTIPHQPSIEITKTSSENDGGDSTMDIGDTIDYTLTITNTGNVTLDTISLTDTLTDGSGIETDLSSAITLVSLNGTPQALLDDLEVGDVAIYTVSYTVDQAAMNSGMVSNIATVTASSPNDVDDVTDTTDTAVENELDQLPSMTLTKSATLNDGGDGSLDLGDTITYTLTLSNTGNVVLTDVVMNDLIEDLLNQSLSLQSLPSYVSSDNSNTTYPGIPTIVVGETVIYEAVFAINQQSINAGGVTNTASAIAVSPKGESIAATSNEVVTTIVSAPEIEVIKTAIINDNGDGDFGVGDVVQYTIEVINTGNVTLEVTVEDVLKDNKGVEIPLTSGTGKLSIPSSIEPGTSDTYTVYQLINQAIVDAGGLTNTATATGAAPDGSTVSDISDDGDTGPTDTGDDPTITLIAINPNIEVIKTATIVGDEDGFIGETDLIDYTIQVTNTGNVTLYNVDLTDTLTDGNGNILSIDTSAWLVRDIAPGETEIYKAYYIIEQSTAESGSVSNIVTATATDPEGNQITVISDDPTTPEPNDPTVTEMDQIPSIEVIKTAEVIDNNGDNKNGIGDTITYTITVENTGNTNLSELTLVDTLTDFNGDLLTLDALPVFVSSNLTGHSLSSLRTGEKFTYTATFTINQQAVNSGGTSNTVSVVASSPGKTNDVSDVSDDGLPTDADADGDPTNDPTTVTTDPNPSLELIKTAIVNDNGDGLIGSGDIIRYTLEVENTGDIVLNNVYIQDETLTDGNGTLLALSSGPDYWQPQTIEVGETIAFTALYVITQDAAETGSLINTATAVGSSPGSFNDVFDISDDGLPTDSDGDGNPLNDPTVVQTDAAPVSSIEVTKTANISDNGDGLVGLGDTINYTITIENTGNTDLSDLLLTDVLTDRNGNVLPLTSGPSFENASLGSSEGTIRKGETATYQATFLISQQALDTGGVSNTVSAVASSPGLVNDVFDISDDGDDSDGNTESDPTVTLTDSPKVPSIEVTKIATVTDNGDGNTGLGDTINYTITVANTGDTPLAGVGVTDTITDLNGVGLILTSGPSFAGATQGSPDGSLLMGETATYSASFVINTQAANAGGVSNTVLASATSPSGITVSDVSDDGDDTDGNTVNDPTIITTSTTTESPSIEVTKTATVTDNGDGSTGLGDTINYIITVANTGDSTLTLVTLTDTLTDLNGVNLTLNSGPLFTGSSLGSTEGILVVGEVATYTATYIITNQTVNAGGVSNTALATAISSGGMTVSDVSDDGDDTDGNTVNDPTITRTTTAPPPSSSIEVTKTATISDNGNSTTGLGDTITFLITVENTGNTGLNNLEINDVFSDLSGNALALTTGPLFVSANLGSTEGTLLVGETATYTATFIVNAQADNAGGVSNTASAIATTPTGTFVNDVSDDGDDTDGNTTNDPTILVFLQDPVDGDFEVFNGMSPGVDGINDYFKIAGIQKYPNNTVKIFNRWGVLVYETKAYGQGDRLFVGISEGRITITKNQKLPTGTYFYVIEFDGENPGRERYTGYLYINRD